MPNSWDLSNVPQNIQKEYLKNQTDLKKSAQESGFLGKIWGTKHSSNNIAGLVCLSGLIVLLISILNKNIDSENKNLFIQTASSLITLSLGYLFGANKKNKEES